MSLRGAGALLLSVLLVGCATPRVVRLDTGQGEPIVYVPPKGAKPVEVDEGAFRKVMTRLVLDMRFSLREEAERPRVRLASWDSEPQGARNDYGAWCSRQDSPGECLTLLEGGFSFLDAKARRQMALAFAWDGVWDGVQDAVKEVVNPLALKAMLTSAMAAYMFLIVAPEPVTKVVAVALTTFVLAYLGVDAFMSLVEGWQRLSADADRAESFRELEDAGHRFGRVMGENGARVLILALTAALSGGAASMASKGPTLPGFASAALAAETQAGFRLSAAMAGGVRSITVAEGVMTVGLAPNAVAMTARGQGGAVVPSSLDGAPTKLLENQRPHLLDNEQKIARLVGVRPVRVTDPDFLRYVNNGSIKWVVTAEEELLIVPHTWRTKEISHAVASGGRPVLAAGEAEIAAHGMLRTGVEITPHSGHYLFGAPSATSARALEIGRQAFSRAGILFP
ncbi:SitA5 family polymorphic toxin [Myxococcus virescens]|uniref:SitA5 family polymorphic toxin n=1 Tax=Myxococcus virescens TaxID=83456 RepID=UPI003DA63983